jgi:hypothetical protein
MMNRFLSFILIILFSAIVVQPAFAAKGGKKGGGGGGAVCKINADTDVAIYIGGGIGPSSQLWAEALIEFWKTGRRQPGQSTLLNQSGNSGWAGDSSLDYVTLTKTEFKACSAVDFANLLLFFMPGGYYAAKGYYWKGDDGAPLRHTSDHYG